MPDSRAASTQRADYTDVTELPGTQADREQVARLYHRYRTAAVHCAGKDVLEVGCGGGLGLGYLAQTARSVVGGDYTLDSVRVAHRHYAGRPGIGLLQLDAHALPFGAAAFDVILLFEALYYLADADAFVEECRRVLRPDGVILISTVNREWSGFHASPFSTHYYDASQLRSLLDRHQFRTDILSAFDSGDGSARAVVLLQAKRLAARAHLIPGSFRYKAPLKRLVYGPLVRLPSEVPDGLASYEPASRVEVGDHPRSRKILYAVARRG